MAPRSKTFLQVLAVSRFLLKYVGETRPYPVQHLYKLDSDAGYGSVTHVLRLVKVCTTPQAFIHGSGSLQHAHTREQNMLLVS